MGGIGRDSCMIKIHSQVCTKCKLTYPSAANVKHARAVVSNCQNISVSVGVSTRIGKFEMPVYDLPIPVEFPFPAYECQLEFMTTVIRALQNVRFCFLLGLRRVVIYSLRTLCWNHLRAPERRFLYYAPV
jgi:hypothetical protein